MKILNLKSENIKRIEAIDITPKTNLVVITGKNGNGKSSVLDSIFLALSGAAQKSIPQPVRKGQKKASVELDLGDYIVKRNWTDNDTSYLKVETREGARISSPQALLDSLVGRISFDPLEFSRLKSKDQRQVLLDIVQLPKDPAAIDLEKAELFKRRTDINREVKTLEAQIPEIPLLSVPDGPVKLSDLMRAQSSQMSIKLQQERELQEVTTQRAAIKRANALVDSLDKQLDDAKTALRKSERALQDAQAIVSKQVDVESAISSINLQIADSEEINRKVEINRRRKELIEKRDKLQAASEGLTKTMEAMEQEKLDMLAAAQFPLQGLTMDGDLVSFNGIPFQQCAASEQLKISLAIGMTINPKLKVMRILDGSLLDEDNLELVRQVAEANDYQVWLETCNSGAVGIVIEEGKVKSAGGAQ